MTHQRGVEGAVNLAVDAPGAALTLADLARAAGLPQNTLTRFFNRDYGMSPMRWLWSFRVVLAAEMIATAPAWPLTVVAEECGFVSLAHFSRRFRELFGESPSSFREAFRQRSGDGGESGAPAPRVATRELAERAAHKLARSARRCAR